jgi:Alpha/beta hydrolase domain/Lipase C-terminal domain/Lipase (class 2)
MKRARLFGPVASAFLVAVALIAVPLGEAGSRHHPPRPNGIIFVHGGAGSGAQFESQKLRFTGNGYPGQLVTVLEYDSTFSINSMADVHAKLDELVADLKEATRRPQVDILGHSLGTTVMHAYLSTPERAANVAHYVNIDGRTSAAPPGGVPTLALWAGLGAPGRSIGGATNVTLPNQTHVQAATSPEAFVEMYKFFTGKEPRTNRIVRSHSPWITVAGRAVIFPQNTGVEGAKLELWRVSGSSGRRESSRPVASRTLDEDGAFGPIWIRRGKHYEFTIVRPGARTHHFYYEPFQRSDHLVRLLTSVPGGGVTDGPLIPKSDHHSQLTILRYKELWGDQGDGSDVLAINGVNVCTAVICPRSKLVNSVQAIDWNSDGATDLTAPVPFFFAQPFGTGADVFMPAASPPRGTVSVELASRGGGKDRTVNFPNFASSTDRVTVQLNDFEDPLPVSTPKVEGPIPGSLPGDRLAPDLEDTYPFFSTWVDLKAAGFVEEEFYVSGTANAFSTTGAKIESDVPYRTRIIVRRPAKQSKFNGTVLVEWQNVTAGYDLDALWNHTHILREGYAWVGVSAQRVGVDQLAAWSPTRYGDLDVTGGRRFLTDQLSYDVFSQAAQAIRSSERVDPLRGLDVDTVLAIGASQSASRMTIYYNSILPQIEGVFDAYGFIVGSAPTRIGDEPVFQVLSETDVRSPVRPPDTGRFRRWEVAGSAHSGWNGREYRAPLQARDLGAVPEYSCARPPFSRVPLHHVTAAAYDHLARWADGGPAPPTAEPLVFNPDGTKARNELGLALGGIRLSQVDVPIALNTGDNAGESFCILFGTHIPFDEATLDRLYPSHRGYVSAVDEVDHRNVRDGYIVRADARQNHRDAEDSDIGR